MKTWITCKNLSFSYAKDDENVINNLSFKIPTWKMTIIAWANGSGKSTLLSLILRFYECPIWTIFVDNYDIHDLDIPSWKSQIAYVAQDVILFNGTVRENLSYGHTKKISEKRLFEVIEKVWLTDFIKSLPEALETNIGEGGLKFSGWQRQRVAIARALLCNPEIIIFDEATKSIDSKTDDMIMKMLTHEFQNTTRIVVSHHSHHQEMADQIITLEKWSLVQ